MQSRDMVELDRLQRRQLNSHLAALRFSALAARLELEGRHLGIGAREALVRAVIRTEVEISRLEQIVHRPAMPAGPPAAHPAA